MHEIARFLRVRPSRVRKLLTGLGMIEWFRSGRPGGKPMGYTTARGCAIAVAHFRALEGEKEARKR